MSDILRQPNPTTPTAPVVDLAKERAARTATIRPATPLEPTELPEDPTGDLPLIPAWTRTPEGRAAARRLAARRARRAARRWAARQRTDRGHIAQIGRGLRRTHEWVIGFEGVHVQAAAHQAHTATREARNAARRARYTVMPSQRKAARLEADRAQTTAMAAVQAYKAAKREVRRGRMIRGGIAYGTPLLVDTVAALEFGGLGLAGGIAATLGAAAWIGRKPLTEESWDPQERVLGDGDPMTETMLNRAFQAAKVIGSDESLRLVTPCMRDAAAWTVTVDLPAGKTAAKALLAAEEIAAALGVETAQVHMSKTGRAGRLNLWVADELPFTGKALPGPLLALERPMNFWGRIPIGPTVRGEGFDISVVERSGLIGGEPGAGKSASGNTILLAAALDPRVILTLADGKGGGDLEPFEPLCDQYEGDADPEAFYELLTQDVIPDMAQRYALLKSLGVRKVTEPLAAEHPELRQRLLWVDELMYYTTDDEWGRKITAALRNIVSRGRAAGIITFCATQKPGSDVVPTSLRDLLSIRWALRCTTPQASDTILGQGAAAAGYNAKTIEPEMRGAGFLWAEGSNPVLVRADYYDDDQVAALIKRAYAWREAAGTLPGSGPTLADRLRERGVEGQILAALVEEFDRRGDDADWLPGSVLLDALRVAGLDVTPERLAALVVRSEADKRKREWEGSRVSGYPRALVLDTAQKVLERS